MTAASHVNPVPSEPLGPALQEVAKTYELQLLYRDSMRTCFGLARCMERSSLDRWNREATMSLQSP
jgi:hypothetical protein